MTGRPDRDRAIEQILRQPPVSPRAGADGLCVDAEMLAAWTEGRLDHGAASAVESHLSSCERCQMLLAVFADSAPTPIAVTTPLLERWARRWFVPAAAASAAVLAWLLVTRPPVLEPPAATTVRTERAIEGIEGQDEGPPVSTPAPVPAPSVTPSPQRDDVSQPRAESPAPAPSPRFSAQQNASDAAPTFSTPDSAAPAIEVSSALPTVQPAARAASRPVTSEAGRVADNRSAPEPPMRVPATTTDRPAPALSSERSFAVSETQAFALTGMGRIASHARVGNSPVVEFSAPAAVVPGATSAASGAAAPRPPAAPPLPPLRWRIFASGRIERAVGPAGAWEPVQLDAALVVTAGSAPLASVCWLVTSNGIVLRTTNGVDFLPTSFGIPVVLQSVEAFDAARAVVSSNSGRSFTTDDGGATWRELP